MAKMKPEIKEAWLKKLRSGEVEQSFGSLFDGEKCCAIGVLALVCAEAGLAEISGGGDVRRGVRVPGHLGSMHTGLPFEVCEAINLDNSAEERVISMNDIQKATFEQIAANIEHYL